MENENTENNDKAMSKTDEEVITLPALKILWVGLEDDIINKTVKGLNRLALRSGEWLPFGIRCSILMDGLDILDLERLLQESNRHHLVIMPHQLKKHEIFKKCSGREKEKFFFFSEKLNNGTASYILFWKYLHRLYNYIILVIGRPAPVPVDRFCLNDRIRLKDFKPKKPRYENQYRFI